MENRQDLRSMLLLLPLVIRSSTLCWPSQVVESLKSLSNGPLRSNVNSGDSLFTAIADIRNSLSPQNPSLLLPMKLMSWAESAKWFGEVVPALANLLLRLPCLLESHYQNADNLCNNRIKTGLRMLGPQEAGIVFLSQELIGALLACSFFCLFLLTDRDAKNLPMINFDNLFESLYDSYSEKQENKMKCIIHYFERICSYIPLGFVSFETKVLPLEQLPLCFAYPKTDFWSKSVVPLCPFEVHSSGFIEDESSGGLGVDFANRYLGGGALNKGRVQEEIHFMINPELIAGMLFLPCMEDNEAIEIVGAERFSNYTRNSSDSNLFRFGMETNKAFCGFFDQCNRDHYERLFQEGGLQQAQCKPDADTNFISRINFLLNEVPSSSVDIEMTDGESLSQAFENSDEKDSWSPQCEDKIGIATGNWGCGAFGGDPELKTIIQWLVASQVIPWILSHEWTGGGLRNMLAKYSSQRFREETKLGFFAWLLPLLFAHKAEMLDAVPNTP